MVALKACSIALRAVDGVPHILVFRHPLAGVQLIKGSVEPGESIAAAALRELGEEAGIAGARAVAELGESAAIAAGQRWHFVLMETDDLPEHWVHRCADDGGHDFAFFWHRLAATPDEDWHPVFVRALGYVRGALRR